MNSLDQKNKMKAYSVDKIREAHPKAYAHWTDKDDLERLRKEFPGQKDVSNAVPLI